MDRKLLQEYHAEPDIARIMGHMEFMKARSQTEQEEEDPKEELYTPPDMARCASAYEYLQIAQKQAPLRAAELRLLLMRGWATLRSSTTGACTINRPLITMHD